MPRPPAPSAGVPTIDPRLVFTPGSPVSTNDLFYGRSEQLRRVVDSVPSPGRHPIIFGQRGVGKTSLANVLNFFLPDHRVIRLACVEGDTFKSIWRRALRQVTVVYDDPAMAFTPRTVERQATLHDLLPGDNGVGPADVAEAIGGYGDHGLVFVLDEFDRVTDQPARGGTADLLKTLSDNNPNVTLILVGVGQDVRDLIGEHPSVVRNLVQVEMPKMTNDEIVGLVRKGCSLLRLKTDEEVLAEVAELADGFPFYAHTLGLAILRAAESSWTSHITTRLFREVACPRAVEESIDTFRQTFDKATNTIKASMYPEVLCACAFAACNGQGRFKSGDVAKAMGEHFGDAAGTHSVKRVLGEFATAERGEVLVRELSGNAYLYQFREPMMRPFLRIKARTLLAG